MLTITFSWDFGFSITTYSRHLWTAFFLTFICLLRAKHFYWISFGPLRRVNASVWEHALRHEHKTNTQTSRSLLCCFSFRRTCIFFGDTGLGIRNVFPQCFTHGAGTPLSILARFRAPGNLPFPPYRFLLAENRLERLGMVMRAHAAMSPTAISDWTRHRRTALFFLCLGLHEYPGGTGSLIRPNLHLSPQGNRYRKLEAYSTALDVGDQVRDEHGAEHL